MIFALDFDSELKRLLIEFDGFLIVLFFHKEESHILESGSLDDLIFPSDLFLGLEESLVVVLD
jgi:hypothetical protein